MRFGCGVDSEKTNGHNDRWALRASTAVIVFDIESNRLRLLARLVHITPLLAPTLFSALSLVSISLILVGALHSWLVLLIMVPVSAATVTILFRSFNDTVDASTLAYDVLVVLFAIIWVGFNAACASQHLFVDRDPGFYANTAVWVRDNPDLDMRFEDPFAAGT